MTRVALRIYVDPGEIEVFVQIQRKDGNFETVIAVVDTGAEVSLFSCKLRNEINYRLTEIGNVKVEQAGIAQQTIEATEALITLYLEDSFGGRTKPFEVRAWFADTEIALIGFADILDRATLHVDFRESHSGWIEID